MAIAPRTAEELLRDVQAFQGLSANDLRQLAAASDVRKAARGAPIFREGQPAEGLFVVRTGEVKLTKSGKDGREQILYLARPGRAVVEGVRLDAGLYPCSGVAMRQASAILIPNEAIWSLGQTNAGVLKAIINLRAHRADRNLALVSDLSLRTVPARLASFLCTLVARRQVKGEDPMNLVRDLTTETVAGRLGTVREEISRGLAYLEREGALKVSPDLIEVVNHDRLEELAFGASRSSSGSLSSAPPPPPVAVSANGASATITSA